MMLAGGVDKSGLELGVDLCQTTLIDRLARHSFYWEATTGFEPVMRVLQTLALPLGDVAGLCRE
jgi:hypothetical protein